MTINFQDLSDIEILDFVMRNSDAFAEDIDQDFMKNAVLSVMAGDTVILRRPEGFAITTVGRLFEKGWGQDPADIMFLYVQEEFRGKGVGGDLIEDAKKAVSTGVSITALCEGALRARLFEQHGFSVIGTWDGSETRKLQYVPQ